MISLGQGKLDVLLPAGSTNDNNNVNNNIAMCQWIDKEQNHANNLNFPCFVML